MPKNQPPKSKAPDESAATKRSISMPGSLLDRAEDRARRQGRTLSNYLANLVRLDVDGDTQTKAA